MGKDTIEKRLSQTENRYAYDNISLNSPATSAVPMLIVLSQTIPSFMLRYELIRCSFHKLQGLLDCSPLALVTNASSLIFQIFRLLLIHLPNGPTAFFKVGLQRFMN